MVIFFTFNGIFSHLSNAIIFVFTIMFDLNNIQGWVVHWLRIKMNPCKLQHLQAEASFVVLFSH